MPCDLRIVPLKREHLPGVIELFARERWSYGQDEQRAWRALTASQGVARRLVEQTLARIRCLRLDVISCADPFYDALGARRVSGFRLTRQRLSRHRGRNRRPWGPLRLGGGR